MTELADEFERSAVGHKAARHRRRAVTVTETVTDLDVQAARLALRKAGPVKYGFGEIEVRGQHFRLRVYVDGKRTPLGTYTTEEERPRRSPNMRIPVHLSAHSAWT